MKQKFIEEIQPASVGGILYRNHLVACLPRARLGVSDIWDAGHPMSHEEHSISEV